MNQRLLLSIFTVLVALSAGSASAQEILWNEGSEKKGVPAVGDGSAVVGRGLGDAAASGAKIRVEYAPGAAQVIQRFHEVRLRKLQQREKEADAQIAALGHGVNKAPIRELSPHATLNLDPQTGQLRGILRVPPHPFMTFMEWGYNLGNDGKTRSISVAAQGEAEPAIFYTAYGADGKRLGSVVVFPLGYVAMDAEGSPKDLWK